MLPANRDDRTVNVHRNLDVDEDEFVDAVTDFAVDNGLEVDRTHEGPGLLFRAARNAPERAMFRNRDTLLVAIARTPDGLDVTFEAEMRGLQERGDAWRRRRFLRGAILAGFFVAGGIGAFSNGVQAGDFIPIGIGGLIMSRTMRRVRGEADSREDIQREVANALHRVCDDAERP